MAVADKCGEDVYTYVSSNWPAIRAVLVAAEKLMEGWDDEDLENGKFPKLSNLRTALDALGRL